MITIITSTNSLGADLLKTIKSVAEQKNCHTCHLIKYSGIDVPDHVLMTFQELNKDLRIIRWPDVGLYDGLNQSMTFVTTDYFMFLHAGDVFASDCTLSEINETLEKFKADVLSLGVMFYNGDRISRRYMPEIVNFAPLISWKLPPHTGLVYRTHAISNIWYDTTYKIAADTKFLLHLSKLNKSFQKMNVVAVHMTIGGASNGSLKKFLWKYNEDLRAFRETGNSQIFVLLKKLLKLKQLIFVRKYDA